jgi:uncharacterized protein YkwD
VRPLRLPPAALIFAAVLLVCAVLVGPGSAAAQGAGEPARLITLINEARSLRGLDPLRYEPRLTAIAERLAEAVLRGEAVDSIADGVEMLLREKGYPHMLYGGRHATTDRSAAEMLQGWLDEGGRGSIFLNPEAQEIGVGYRNGAESPVETMAPNIWAVVIADPARPAEEGWAERVRRLINAFRAQHGLEPLERNAFLDRAAMAHARDMLARDYFSHISPDGTDPGERARTAGYDWSRVLENIAAGQRSPREVVDAWVASTEGHREAMLDPAVTEMGVGYVFAPFDPGRVEARHYWALSLGRPRDP